MNGTAVSIDCCSCTTLSSLFEGQILYNSLGKWYHIVSYRFVSYRIVPYRIVSYPIVSYRALSYCTLWYRIVLYRNVSYRVVLYRIVLYSIFSSFYHLVSFQLIIILIIIIDHHWSLLPWQQPSHEVFICFIISARPKITKSTSKPISISQGKTAQCTCATRGVPKPIISWRFNDKRLPNNPKINVRTIDGRSQLTVRNATKDLQGVYSCEAHNKGGATRVYEPCRINVIGELMWLNTNATRGGAEEPCWAFAT